MDEYGQVGETNPNKLKTYVIAGSLAVLVIGVAVFGAIIYRSLTSVQAPSSVTGQPGGQQAQSTTGGATGKAPAGQAGTIPQIAGQVPAGTSAAIPLPGQAANPVPKRDLYNTPDFTACEKKPGEQLNECEKRILGPDWQAALERNYPKK